MEVKLAAIMLALTMLAAAHALAVKPAEFYVASDGNDKHPGTKAKPFASLERARDAIRDLKTSGELPDGGATVWMRAGEYERNATFTLGAEDSGTETAPIIYRACNGETVRLIGGRRIGGFQPVRDPAVLSRLDEAARGSVLQTDLKAQGITDFGKLKPRGFGRANSPSHLELFFNGRPMTLARWPNEGWVTIAAVPAGQRGGKFTYEGDRPKRWTQSDDIWLHGYWTWDWADSYEKIKAINTDTREIETHPPHGAYGYTAGKRFYALNLLEELDQPGEYYVDRESGILYFWPPAPIRKSEILVSVMEKPLISLEGASHVTIQGLVLECVRGDAVWVIGGTRNSISECVIRNTGNGGITLKDGTENSVVGCEIYDTGDSGITVQAGDRAKLLPAKNRVEDCRIHRFSRWCRTYRPGVHILGVGNRIAHNLIYDAPHSAIILGGNEHVIEFNEIHHVCAETGDAGAFYVGRDYSQRGNVVRFNYFHHLSKTEGLIGWTDVMSVYLDDWTSGTRVFGNVFYKAGRAAMIGGGRDNVIQNNIFVDCTPAVHVDARGLGWANYFFDGTNNWLVNRLHDVNYKQPPYSERYPELLTLYDDEPAVPKGNSITRNICWGGKWMEIYDEDKFDKKVLDIRDNLLDQDPRFVDPAREDFRLNDDSPAWKLGFKRIPVERIGLRKGR